MSKDPPHQERVDSAADERALRSLSAGLGYCPATDPEALFDAITFEQRVTDEVTLPIPSILHQYFQVAAPKYGLAEVELMLRTLETHRFADQKLQHLILAISGQTQDLMKAPFAQPVLAGPAPNLA